MTVIAWDGRVLAADRQSQCGDCKVPVTKIYRMHRCLVGISGNLSMGMEMFEWLKADADPDKFRQDWRDPDKGASLLMITHDGLAWKYESSPYPFQHHGSTAAAGSGMEVALATMHCGKSAVEAVKLASMYLASCGLGYDSLELDPAP